MTSLATTFTRSRRLAGDAVEARVRQARRAAHHAEDAAGALVSRTRRGIRRRPFQSVAWALAAGAAVGAVLALVAATSRRAPAPLPDVEP